MLARYLACHLWQVVEDTDPGVLFVCFLLFYLSLSAVRITAKSRP